MGNMVWAINICIQRVEVLRSWVNVRIAGCDYRTAEGGLLAAIGRNDKYPSLERAASTNLVFGGDRH